MVLVRKGRDLAKHLYCEVDGVAVKLRPQDLSLAGLFIPGATRFPVDRELKLVLHSPIGELSAHGQVVQVVTHERAQAEGRSPGTGLLFINLGDEDRAFIGLTLDALLRSSQVDEPVPPARPRSHDPAPPERPERAKREPAFQRESMIETGPDSGPPRRSRASRRAAAAERRSIADAAREELKSLRSRASGREDTVPQASITDTRREPEPSQKPSPNKHEGGAQRTSIADARRDREPPQRQSPDKPERTSPGQSLARAADALDPLPSKREQAVSQESATEPRRDAIPPAMPVAIKRDAAPQREAPVEAARKEPAPAPKRPNPEAERILRQLEQELAALQHKSPFAILALAADADLNAAKAAFLSMSKRYHPHAYARFDSPEISRAATELFIAHKKAFGSLQLTLRPAAAPAAPANPPLPPPAPSAKISSPTKAALRPSAVPQIVPVLPPAASSSMQQASLRPKPATRSPSSWPPPKHPSQPPPSASIPPPIGARRASDAERALAAGMKHLAASRFDDAAVDFERARALHPGSHDPELWLRVCHARHAKASGQRDETLAFYREVLELDPEHREALEHINSQGPRKRAGLIQKFFGPDDE